jgi:hypothetical protein
MPTCGPNKVNLIADLYEEVVSHRLMISPPIQWHNFEHGDGMTTHTIIKIAASEPKSILSGRQMLIGSLATGEQQQEDGVLQKPELETDNIMDGGAIVGKYQFDNVVYTYCCRITTLGQQQTGLRPRAELYSTLLSVFVAILVPFFCSTVDWSRSNFHFRPIFIDNFWQKNKI